MGWLAAIGSIATATVPILWWWLSTGRKKWSRYRARKKLKDMEQAVDSKDDNAVDNGLDDLGL